MKAQVNILASPIFFTLATVHQSLLAVHGYSLVLRPLPPPTWPGNEASLIQIYRVY